MKRKTVTASEQGYRQNRIAQMEQEFLFQPAGTVKVEYLARLSVCSGKFSVEPPIPFAFKPVKPEILPKWKAALNSQRSCWPG